LSSNEGRENDRDGSHMQLNVLVNGGTR